MEDVDKNAKVYKYFQEIYRLQAIFLMLSLKACQTISMHPFMKYNLILKEDSYR